MERTMMSPVVVFKGKKGRELYEKIVQTKPVPVDHAKKAAEIRAKLERQGVKF